MKKLVSPFVVVVVLLTVFSVTFAVAFFSSFAIDLITAFSGGEVKSATPAPIPHLADDLKASLENAENPDFPFSFASALNPFADQTNLEKSAASGSVNGQTTNSQFGTSTVPSMDGGFPKLQPSNNSTLSRQGSVMPPVLAGSGNSSPSGDINNTGKSDGETLARYRDKQRDRLAGKLDQGDASSIYSVEEVKAIGVVGNKEKREILFYSPVTKQTFSAPPGAKFRDGEIESVNETGVSFKKSDQSKTTAKWTRSAKGETVNSDTDEPVINQPAQVETSNRPLNIQNKRVKPVISQKKKGF